LQVVRIDRRRASYSSALLCKQEVAGSIPAGSIGKGLHMLRRGVVAGRRVAFPAGIWL
jgi:hypothetical protein